MTFSGFVLADGRRGGICFDEKPRCVGGHRLRTKDRDPVLNDAIITCGYHESHGQLACRARLYVAQLSIGPTAVVRGSGERCWLVVEVTKEHVDRMRREPMLFLERMIVLGVALPGVETDILTQLSPEGR